MFKKLVQYVMVSLLALAPASGLLNVRSTKVVAATTTMAAPQINASAAIALDPATGQVLYEQNAEQVLPIASMTKMITAYIILEQIKQGKLTWTQTVKPDGLIYQLSQNRDLTNVPLQADGQYTVKALFQAMMVASANDAAMMLANQVAGSQQNFVNLMRQKVADWGIKDAQLYSVSGLNNQFLGNEVYPGSPADAENEMSAIDVAIVAQKLLADYPEVLVTTKQAHFTFGAQTSDETAMSTWNLMLPGEKNAPQGYVVDGLKTGTTDKAGDCFTGTATKDGQRILTVVMHANGDDTGRRFIETNKLMQFVFDGWQAKQLVQANQKVKAYQTATVKYGRQKTVSLITDKPIFMWVPKTTTVANVKWQYQVVKGGIQRQLVAPIKKNLQVGRITPQLQGVTNRYIGKTPQYTLRTKVNVPKANLFVLIGDGIQEFLTDLF
ncbi:serine hydrolase [Latilactobacillus graminis]|uniref:serine-type D-Ala-D-Ala carboxypeptidase n=2 Tax=Latilactobacillus graminis TaxID=60519 RepID=A0AA89L4S0_9LACO|nr:serine hydrolase [Latilactobacillus graminis]KRM24328.1 D-alanyl-D-alanine carboxypeptidase dacA [Latilactobacillus graminis DSM 20719]QFP80117.1 D-alanyl-D-alanine carboxypeptidase [Latilactobacillus graminis]